MYKMRLFNDIILGHLFCVYSKIYPLHDNKYHFIINNNDSLRVAIPVDLQKQDLCDIKLTLGVNTIALFDRHIKILERNSKIARIFPSNITAVQYTEKERELLNDLIKKYVVHESKIEGSDLAKIRAHKETYESLAYVISFDQAQYKKLVAFIKEYCRLYLQKELDGQQNYVSPEVYLDIFIQTFNNRVYRLLYRTNNILLDNNGKTRDFFCHNIMVLALEDKIKIRRMGILDQKVVINLDNLLSPPTDQKVTKSTDTVLPAIDQDINCDNLHINFKKAQLWMTNGEPITITSGNLPIRFLKLLYEYKNTVVKYEFIAEKLNLPGKPEQYKGQALGIKDIKSELKGILKNAGMTDQEFSLLIRTIAKVGYKMYC